MIGIIPLETARKQGDSAQDILSIAAWHDARCKTNTVRAEMQGGAAKRRAERRASHHHKTAISLRSLAAALGSTP